jgi:hypothetical protein
VFEYDDLNKEVFDATFIKENYGLYNDDMSTRLYTGKNFIVVSDDKGILRSYSKSTNEEKEYTTKSNAVIFIYRAKEVPIMGYNNQNTLIVESPLGKFEKQSHTFTSDEKVLRMEFLKIWSGFPFQSYPNTFLLIKVLTRDYSSTNYENKSYLFSLSYFPISQTYNLTLIE